jgi:hypothetical protein
MAVRCSKCGEELLGAVNRCWKCGQMFALRPEIDGRPPVRTEPSSASEPPLEAIVLDSSNHGIPFVPPKVFASPAYAPAMIPIAMPRFVHPRRASTAELIDARRSSMMAMGGTVGSLVLGVFAAVLSIAFPPAAVIAVLGLAMGIWGLSSPRRNWALIGMLACCVAIGIGAYGGVKKLYIYVQSQRPTVIDNQVTPAYGQP